jgi:hypothetical protein
VRPPALGEGWGQHGCGGGPLCELSLASRVGPLALLSCCYAVRLSAVALALPAPRSLPACCPVRPPLLPLASTLSGCDLTLISHALPAPCTDMIGDSGLIRLSRKLLLGVRCLDTRKPTE